MGRGSLSQKDLKLIEDRLPDTLSFQIQTQRLSRDLISMNMPYDSEVPVAAVCFADLGDTLCDVRYALHECLACGLYYRGRSDPPNETGAIFMERYYLEDAAFRLYAAGEHLANSIVFMLELKGDDLKPYRTRKTSQQSIVGGYLHKKRPGEQTTDAICSLAASQEWIAVIGYRNELVHEQPPTVEGLGIQYRRKTGWRATEGCRSWTLEFGGGDSPQYQIREIEEFVFSATEQLLRTSWICLDRYCEVLKRFGASHSDD